jgi:hypothetical protein
MFNRLEYMFLFDGGRRLLTKMGIILKNTSAVHLPPCTKNDMHKHDMLPHHFNEVFY